MHKNPFANRFTAKKQKSRVPFNPGTIAHGITERFYAKGWGIAVKLSLEQTDTAERLLKKHDDDEASVALAKKLLACRPNNRCRSLVCPQCSNALQKFTTGVANRFLTSHPDRDQIVCVTVVPSDGEIRKGNLNAGQHQRNVRRWKEHLGREGVTWFLGATDWSFNEHLSGRYKPGWQEHFNGFTVTDDPTGLKARLLEQFPATDAIPRPVKVRVWDGDQRAIEYMIKREFWRRIGRDHGTRFDKETQETRDCRATDKQPLRSSQKHELLLHLEEIGIQGRFLMKWLQFTNVRGVGWRIVDRAPKVRTPGKGKKWVFSTKK
jgi:hypothetical protein